MGGMLDGDIGEAIGRVMDEGMGGVIERGRSYGLWEKLWGEFLMEL